MHPKVSIGFARSRDAARIAELSRAHIEIGLPPTWPAARVAGRVRDPDAVVVKAVQSARLVGFAIMGFGTDEAHLELLAVTPSRRRRGIGRSLVRWLEESALTAGVSIVRLELRVTNPGALRFYESLGYRPVQRVAGYYQGREDALRMARDLWENVSAHAR